MEWIGFGMVVFSEVVEFMIRMEKIFWANF